MLARHPFSEAMGTYVGEREFQLLQDDLVAHGQLDPIILYQGMVLDGWHRYYCLIELGITPRCEEFCGSDEQARALVESREQGRVWGTLETRAEAFTGLKELARLLRTPAGKEYSQTKLAEATGLSRASIQRHAKVVEHAIPEIVEAVEEGEISLNDAVAVATLPKPEQKAALKAKENGKAATLKEAAGVRDNGHGNAAPIKHDELLDAINQTIPPRAKPAFAMAEEIHDVCGQLQRIITFLEHSQKKVGGRLIANSTITALRDVKTNLNHSRATHVCPYCGGEGCNACKLEGWVSKSIFEAAPNEMKAAAKERGTANVPF